MIQAPVSPISQISSPISLEGLCFEGSQVGTAAAHGVSVAIVGRIDEIGGKAVATPAKVPQELAKVILECHRQEGMAWLKSARGQFVLAISDDQGITCFRSQLSPYSLFYSDKKVSNRLLSFRTDKTASLDVDYFAQYLVQPQGLQFQSSMTPLRGVKRLPAGYVLHLKNGKASIEPFDVISEHLFWDYEQKGDAIAPQIDQLFHQIISERIDNHVGPVACELSGGLDSSYVNSLVATKREAHAAIMYSFSERASHQFSERCAETIAREKGLQLKVVGLDEISIPDLKQVASFRDEPCTMFWQGELFGPVLQKHIQNNSLLCTGFGSDQIFLHLTEILPFYLKSREWKRFFRTAKEMGRTLQRSRLNLMWQSLVCLLPVSLRKRLQSIFSALKLNPFNVEDIAPGASGVDLAPWMNRSMEKFVGRGFDSVEYLDYSYLFAPGLVMGSYLEDSNIRHFHPFCDSRLIRFVREKVSAHLIHDYNSPYKHLLRQAQVKWVPDEVRNRTKNEFGFDGFYSLVLRKNVNFLRQLLNEPLPVGEELIDRAKLLDAFEQLQFGVSTPSAFYLSRLISYLMWWRNFR